VSFVLVFVLCFRLMFLRIRRVGIVATTLELGQLYLLPFFVHHVDFKLEGLSGVASTPHNVTRPPPHFIRSRLCSRSPVHELNTPSYPWPAVALFEAPTHGVDLANAVLSTVPQLGRGLLALSRPSKRWTPVGYSRSQ
jgi:hypothetical protein